MDLLEKYLKKLMAPPAQLAIDYDDPKKFRFKPPGVKDKEMYKYEKGRKAKFKHKAVVGELEKIFEDN